MKKNVVEWKDSVKLGLIVDFYNNSFVPDYSDSRDEIIKWADGFLYDLANMASESMTDGEDYYGLRNLLVSRVENFGDPDSLEILIGKLGVAGRVKV